MVRWGLPGLADLTHLPGAGRLLQTLEALVAFAHAEVVHRQDVGAFQGVDEEHFDRPAPHTLERHQSFDQGFVGQMKCLGPGGDDPIHRGLGDAVDGGELGGRKAAASLQLRIGSQEPLRR